MTDRVIIPLGAIGVLDMPRDAFEQYIVRAEPAPGAPALPEQSLLDGPQLAAALQVPVSWIMESARNGTLPSVKIGRYVRFSLAEVRDFLPRGSTGKQPVGHVQGAVPKRENPACYQSATGLSRRVAAASEAGTRGR